MVHDYGKVLLNLLRCFTLYLFVQVGIGTQWERFWRARAYGCATWRMWEVCGYIGGRQWELLRNKWPRWEFGGSIGGAL